MHSCYYSRNQGILPKRPSTIVYLIQLSWLDVVTGGRTQLRMLGHQYLLAVLRLD